MLVLIQVEGAPPAAREPPSELALARKLGYALGRRPSRRARKGGGAVGFATCFRPPPQTRERRGGHMAPALSIGKSTLLGNYRENNEASIDVKQFPDMTVCLVADGMGGQAAGEVASKRAIEIVPRELKKHLSLAMGNEETKNIVRRSVVQANEEIMAMAALDRELKNMGTTIVLTLERKASSILYVTGMGDSRVYQVRGRNITQLTVDHSIAQALVEAKTISAAEARTHRYKNVLWKYLGSQEVGEGPEVKVVPI